MKQEKFSIIKRLKSFKYAFNGLYLLIKNEQNAQIHAIATISAITAGILCKISATEWITITFAIGLVFATELINSAIEQLADFASPNKNEKIKAAKDMAAAAVLVAAIIAVIIAIFVFGNKITTLIQK